LQDTYTKKEGNKKGAKTEENKKAEELKLNENPEKSTSSKGATE